MNCYSCGKQKEELHSKNSELLPGVKLLMCKSCIEAKYEPRHVIIIASRSFGAEKVRNFIVNRRYLGEEITGVELIPYVVSAGFRALTSAVAAATRTACPSAPRSIDPPLR